MPSWTYLQDYTGMHGQQNKKTVCRLLTLGLLSRKSLCTAKELRTEHPPPPLTIYYEARE